MLTLALTHRSYVAEHPDNEPNERLEFLGDSVLGLTVTDYIYKAYPDLAEGKLAKLRAAVVNASSLAVLSRSLGVGKLMRLGRGEHLSGGRKKESILADAFEAILGAVYVDGGWEPARRLVLEHTREMIEAAAENPGKRDYKTQLQELAAGLGLGTPSYQIESSGPDHDKRFNAVVVIDGHERGEGTGTSKKRAEQIAARSAYATVRAQAGEPENHAET